MTRAPGWWAAVVAGWVLMAVAVWGLVTQVDVVAFLRWFAGGLLLHDALAVPLAAMMGTVLARVIRDREVRDAVCWGLWVAALVVLVWWPSSTGAGLHPDNPSILPRPYLRNVLLVAGFLGLVVAVRAVAGAGRRPGGTGAQGR